MTHDLRRYLAVSRGEQIDDAPPAAVIYRRAQALPYRLAMLTIAVWFVIAAVGALVARLQLGFDLDDTIILTRSRRSCSRSPARSTSSCGIATCSARCSRT